jgi:hypothetical protein
MKKTLQNYRDFFCDSTAHMSLLGACLLFLASLVVNFYASQYAYISKGNPVSDIVLDNIPVIQIDNSFVIGTILFVILVGGVILSNPKRVPFILKTMALFIVVRAFFVTLTHLGPSPLNTLSAPSEIGRAFTSGADLFFSGHTGMPFLFALMYWFNKRLRIIFLVVSVIAAAGVLLGHVHYSIDVASAYFITYGIYIMATKTWTKDFEVFRVEYLKNE